MATAELPPVSELVPHRGEVLLLDRVLEHADASTAVRVVVDRRAWLRSDDGSVPAWIAVEYMAQCIAAHEGIRARLEGRPPVRGSLAAAMGVRLHRDSFQPGEWLRVETRRVRGRPGLGVLSHFCTVHQEVEAGGGPLLVEGRLSISIPRLRSSARTQR